VAAPVTSHSVQRKLCAMLMCIEGSYCTYMLLQPAGGASKPCPPVPFVCPSSCNASAAVHDHAGSAAQMSTWVSGIESSVSETTCSSFNGARKQKGVQGTHLHSRALTDTPLNLPSWAHASKGWYKLGVMVLCTYQAGRLCSSSILISAPHTMLCYA
jgi:hypothetical protein